MTTTSKEKSELIGELHWNQTAEIRLLQAACTSTHLNPQEMLCIQPSGSFLSRATFDVCALMWAAETDAEGEGYTEEIAGANERAHPERRFISAAIASACWVISLGWFASVSASWSGRKEELLVLSSSLPPTQARNSDYFCVFLQLLPVTSLQQQYMSNARMNYEQVFSKLSCKSQSFHDWLFVIPSFPSEAKLTETG